MPVDHPEVPVVPVRGYTPLVTVVLSFVLVMAVLLLLRQTWVPA